MSTLATVITPANSSAICSRAGAICLQGPHHSAQKSTSTGPEACRTSFSKDSSVTFTVLMEISLCVSGFANLSPDPSCPADVGGQGPGINCCGPGRQGF